MRRGSTVVGSVGLAVATLLLVVGCGDDDKPSEPPPEQNAEQDPMPDPVMPVSLSAWVADVNMECMEATERAESMPAPETLDEVPAALDMAADSAHQLTDAMVAAGTPDEMTFEVATYIDLSWQVSDTLTDAAETAKTDPQAAVTETQAIDELALQADAVALGLGLDECYEAEPTVEPEYLDADPLFDVSFSDGLAEAVTTELQTLGFTEAEARCLADRADEIIALSEADVIETDAAAQLFFDCGIDITRIVELFGA